MNVVRLQPYFLLALLGGALVLSFFVLKPFLGPVVLAAVFATIFYPVYTRILKKIGKHPSIAAFITLLICALCIIIPLVFLGARVAIEADQLYNSLVDGTGKSYLDAALTYTDSLLAEYVPQSQSVSATLSDNLDTYAKTGIAWLIKYLGAVFSSIAGLLLRLFIFFVALYYLLRDGKTLVKHLIELSPLSDKDDHVVLSRLTAAVNSTVKGNLTIAAIQGALTSLGFLIFMVPNAILWGCVTAIAALIPGFGTSLVLVPAIIFLFMTGHTLAGVGLLIWGVFAVGLIDNFLGPKLIGHGSGTHPLLVMLSVLGGISFFGPLGLFLGPLTISLLLALISIYTYIAKEHTE